MNKTIKNIILLGAFFACMNLQASEEASVHPDVKAAVQSYVDRLKFTAPLGRVIESNLHDANDKAKALTSDQYESYRNITDAASDILLNKSGNLVK